MYIGIDIGGTKINSVLMLGNKIIRQIKMPIKSKSKKQIIIAQLFNCINQIILGIDSKKIKGIGIGVPGPVYFKKQKILHAPNVIALKNLDLAKIVKKKFKIRTIIDNDANCFGRAELVIGTKRGKKNIIGLTLGAGIGGFLALQGQLYRGEKGIGGEIGHMIIVKDGRLRSSSCRGCLEAYVSVKGIMKTAKEIGLINVKTPKEITQLAKKGNKQAIKVYDITGQYLGIGLANLVNVFNPDIIIIGGGIANAGKFLFDPTRRTMRKNILSPLAKNTKIVKTKIGKNAGAIGAAFLFTDYKH